MKTPRVLEMICVIFVFCAATAIASPAQILTTLYKFHGSDGALPGGLMQASDGNFYGVTFWGGASGNCSEPNAPGCGTLFKLSPSGALTILYSFCPQPNCADGAAPEGALVQATDGNFYGTTVAGGASGNCGIYAPGCGTVFKITPSGTLTTLYRFCSEANCADGSEPSAGLVQATDGSFYGTTEWGGTYGVGTVFKITAVGTLTTLHSFNGDDGYVAGAGLIQATDGNFYGTTVEGGANGGGTVFKITPNGTLTTLYSFSGSDGTYPSALVQASDGNFYGTTELGGSGRWGTVFKITPGGTLSTLYSFDGPDGAYAEGVLQATDGNFYGKTSEGGADGYGTLFKVTPGGALTTLHSFEETDGAYPTALVQAPDGNFYGTTDGGGTYGYGTVFRLVSVRRCFSCALEW